MSQVELARRVVLRPETLGRLEKQRQTASLEVIVALFRVLGVPPEQLTGGIDPDRVLRNSPPQLRPGEPARQCKGCGLVKPLSGFVPIKRTRTGYYGRCRRCRGDRERERYQTDPVVREATKALYIDTVSSIRLPCPEQRADARTGIDTRVPGTPCCRQWRGTDPSIG